jgi:hypothetical protein
MRTLIHSSALWQSFLLS